MVKRNLFMVAAVVVAVVVISASVAEAQRGRGGGGAGRGFGGPGFGAGPVDLLQREDVQGELKLTDAQIKEIEQLSEESRNSRRERFSGVNFRDQSNEERQEAMARMREEMQKEQSQLREKVGTILNSKQRDRFSELEFQFQMQRGSVQAALEAGGVELSDADREKLDEARRAMEEKINAQIAEIRLNAQKEILATVVSQSQIEGMMGDVFQFAPQERQPRGAFGAGGGRDAAGAGGRTRGRPAQDEGSSDSLDDGQNSRRRRR